jgi:hypothetical protein
MPAIIGEVVQLLMPWARGTVSRPHSGSARNGVMVDDGVGPPIIERKKNASARERERLPDGPHVSAPGSRDRLGSRG